METGKYEMTHCVGDCSITYRVCTFEELLKIKDITRDEHASQPVINRHEDAKPHMGTPKPSR